MARLIWNKVRNIRIGDTHVPFEIKHHDGSSLVADSNSMGYNLAQAVNGQGNVELCLNKIGWSLNRGQPDYNWASFWDLAGHPQQFNINSFGDTHSNMFGEGSNMGDVGYLKDTNNRGIEAVGYGFQANAWIYSNTYYYIDSSHHAPLQPYWNIENESVYVDIPVPSNEGLNYWYQDDDGVWKLLIGQASDSPNYQETHLALGDMGDYHESATWYNESLNGHIYVPLEDITNEILYGLKLTLVQNQDSVVEWIHGPSFYFDDPIPNYMTAYVPMSITQEAPDFDFSISLSVAGLPSSVTTGETVEGTVTITSNNYNGGIYVYALDHEDDLDAYNSYFGTYLDDSDAAQYGQVDSPNSLHVISNSLGIVAGQSIDVPIAYTSNHNTSQTDSFSVIAYMNNLSESAYGVFYFQAQQQFDNLSNSDKIAYSDTPTIQIIKASENPVSVYTPSAQLIEKPCDVIFHLLEQELGYDKDVDFNSLYSAREEESFWKLAFSLNKEIEAKKLIKEIADCSKTIPTLSADSLKFITIKDTYDGTENISTINANDVLKYKFSRTPLRDLKTKIEVKYYYDYGMKKFKSSRIVHTDISYFFTGTYKNIAQNIPFSNLRQNYYGLKMSDTQGGSTTPTLYREDTTEIIESKYIRRGDSAELLALHKLHMNKNVHNIIEMTLPLKYYNLEIGDLIEFDKMILGKKIYGEKYVIDSPFDMPIRCGQYILPLFMITDTTKGLRDIRIKAIQLHHLSTGNDLIYKGETYQAVTNYLNENPLWVEHEQQGDINNDGFVDVLDLIGLVNFIVDGSAPTATDEEILIMDINNDGNINLLDVVIMVNNIVEG